MVLGGDGAGGVGDSGSGSIGDAGASSVGDAGAGDVGGSGAIGDAGAGGVMTLARDGSKAPVRFCDISDLGKLRVSGKSAHEFVRVMFSADTAVFEDIGGVCAALMLTGEAEIIDVALVIRSGTDEYMITTSEHNADEAYAWLKAHAAIKDGRDAIFKELTVTDESSALADIVVFGTGVRSILEELAGAGLDTSPHARSLTLVELVRLPTLLLRTPVLRKLGLEAYELLCPAQNADTLMNALLSFPEIDPMAKADYVALRSALGTWFCAQANAEYSYPDELGLLHLARPEMDFVGGKALQCRLQGSRPA